MARDVRRGFGGCITVFQICLGFRLIGCDCLGQWLFSSRPVCCLSPTCYWTVP